MKKKTYVLVINLKSRQSTSTIDEVRAAFDETENDYEIITTKDPSKLQKLFQKAIDLRPDVIVLGGGDGTLINGIEYLSANGYKGEIGLLPMGTANYFARDLGIPLEIKGSVDRLLHGKNREVPLGVANGKLFALTFILGITQAVSENVSDERKKILGQFAYVLELFKQTATHEPFSYTVTSPSLKRPLKGLTHQLIVYNSDLNHQVKLVPDHKLDKKTLRVVISRCGKSKLRLYFGFLVHITTLGKIRPYMHVFEATSLRIDTKPAMTADYDGETSGSSPYEIAMYNRTVHLLC